MRLIDTELLQQQEGRKRGKYLITLEVTDYDLDMLEDLSSAYCTIEARPECEFKPKYSRWLEKTWHCFWKLWNRYPPIETDKVRISPSVANVEYIEGNDA